jgi:hypothetical protein
MGAKLLLAGIDLMPSGSIQGHDGLKFGFAAIQQRPLQPSRPDDQSYWVAGELLPVDREETTAIECRQDVF